MNIVIVGLGNVGGSYALATKEFVKEANVYGIDIDEDTLNYAENNNIIDKGFTDYKEIIPKADLVIFSLYPMLLREIVSNYMPFLKTGAILTDVTGVKESVMAEVLPFIRDDIDFIFGHPMAGRESSGIEFASLDVIQNANYLITPTVHNKEKNINFIIDYVKKIGFGKVSQITPAFHDEVIGFTSQLAHVIAVSLINSDDINRNTKKYTGDSYRDLTRIANINEKLWPELFLMNKNYLVSHIQSFKDELDKLEVAIKDNDMETMEAMMLESKKRYHDLHNLSYKE